ncbi:MAG: uroporphyrinogen-III synthase [Nitrososphaerales archaeon]
MVQNAFTLKGRTIAITRSYNQAEEICKMIKDRGGKPYLIPTIEIKMPTDLSPIKNFIYDLKGGKIDYIIFMSVNGIKHLIKIAEMLGLKDELINYSEKTVIMAVGPKTAKELKNYQIHVDLIPEKYSSEGIIESLRQLDINGKSIFIPRTKGATPTLKKGLKEMGAKVHEIYVYETILPKDSNIKDRFLQDLICDNIHAIIFGSSLCVKNLFLMLMEKISMEKLRDLFNSKLTIVAIGPTTAETLKEMGLKVDIIPDKHLFEEAIIALAHYWK